MDDNGRGRPPLRPIREALGEPAQDVNGRGLYVVKPSGAPRKRPVSQGDRARKPRTRPEDISRIRRRASERPDVPDAGMRNRRRVVEERTRRKPPSYPTRFLWGLALALLLLYLGGYTVTYLSRPQIAETRVELGSIEIPKIYDGMIVRDEVVYRSGASGVVVFALDDLAHVRKAGEVYSVQDAAKVAEIESKLKDFRTSIIDMQENRDGLSLYEEEIRQDNAAIKKTVDAMSFRLPSDVSGIYELATKVRQGLETRNMKLLSENRGSLRSLVQGLDIYEAQLADARQRAFAAQSGVVSYLTDGLEEVLTLDSLGTLTKEQTTMKVDYAALEYKREVAPEDVVCKIVQSNTWYIAAYVNTEAAANWNVNSLRTIYIDEDGRLTPLEVRVDRLEKASDTESYVVFRSIRRLTDYLDCRNLRFRLEKDVMEGLKIPNTAIVDKTMLKIPLTCVMKDAGGRDIVMKRVNDVDEPIPISIISSDDVFCHVLQDYTNLRFGDMLVTKAEEGIPSSAVTIAELDNVKGVYVTNAGSTVFRRINTGGATMSNATYTVLDPAINSSVKVHDKIVADVRNIDEKQLIY